MKWLSSGLRNFFWCMTLGAVILGVLSVFLGTGHAAVRTEGMQASAPGMAPSNAAVPSNLTVSTESRKSVEGCNEALDALSLCTLPKNFKKPSSNDEAGQVHQAVSPAPEKAAPEKVVVDAAKDAGGAPFPTLPVLAFSLAVAGALLAAFNFCAMSLKEGRENPARQAMVRSLGFLSKSPTAAIAKERLLQFRT